MQPVHECSQDCEMIHREIGRKLVALIYSSRLQRPQEAKISNTWFGLPSSSSSLAELTSEEEIQLKTLLFAPKQSLQLAIYLLPAQSETTQLGLEDSGHKHVLEQGKILLELWSFEFKHSNSSASVDESMVTRLYRRTAFFVRSLHALLRLLPVHSSLLAVPGKLTNLRISCNLLDSEAMLSTELRESLIESKLSAGDCAMEAINSTELGVLQCLHGDLKLSVQFRKNCQFYAENRSSAIKVPKGKISAAEIQIKSSPAATSAPPSGEWVEMAQDRLTTVFRPNSFKERGGRIVEEAITDSNPLQLAELIKVFEKPPIIEWPDNPYFQSDPSIRQVLQQIDHSRSEKIHFDRWLEELEIEREVANVALDGTRAFDEDFGPLNVME